MAEVDKAQQARTGRSPRRLGIRSLAPVWLARAWRTGAWPAHRGRPGARGPDMAGAEQGDTADVRATLQALPSMLDGAELPNGVVELVIEDGELATQMVFDIHDRRLTPVERGSAVPWASIAGSPEAWALALTAPGDVSALRLTGEEHLARRMLAALAARSATAETPA